ncbi:hypothetical protein [Mycobacterium lacus]|uniref:Uncharacterized protein n=1 Tax=Mycobacterium lacus TaxID=169765 RepID=A0A1X1YU82_9MYCO|nr:hypothetical protein [Mycobacterium lacus]MCV7123177.1 hypothetical protein [Mycobacterium lacus]ORW14632.1 hypothetical protein AWC15_12745 [Mycobacterium lacus]BBX95747.1 hypothetical protein MLAC_10410 [Mycobacterium lacus]
MTDDAHDPQAADNADAATEVDEADGEGVEEAEPAADRPRRDPWRLVRGLRSVPVILVLLLVVSAGVATWLFYNEYRPDRQTDPGVARAAAAAASEGTVALLSYSPDTLENDFAAARTHLGGDFLLYYNNFTAQIVAPAAKQKSLKTTARVMRAAVSELKHDSAVVLVFVDQTTTTKENPKPAVAASSVLVTMTRVDGKWLITKFDPI